ncbi:MAG: hypothetical protein M0Z87_04370 [Actinomycetota bacterium]|nr:hypothetical protein [Actinomycetota bacterium]
MTELIALDIETTGLDVVRDRILSVALYASETDCVAFFGDESRVIGSVDAWLRSRPPSIVVGWHSSAFDCPMLRHRADSNGEPLTLELRRMEHGPRRPNRREQAGWPAEGAARFASSSESGTSAYWARFGSHEHLDIAPFWRPWAQMRGLSGGLKSVAKANGIPVLEVDRTRMSTLSADQLCQYNLSDVRATYRLARMLPQSWLTGS